MSFISASEHPAYDLARRSALHGFGGFKLVYNSGAQTGDGNVSFVPSEPVDLALVFCVGAQAGSDIMVNGYFDDQASSNTQNDFTKAAEGLFSGAPESELWYAHRGEPSWKAFDDAETVFFNCTFSGTEGPIWSLALFSGSWWWNPEGVLIDSRNYDSGAFTEPFATDLIVGGRRNLLAFTEYKFNANPGGGNTGIILGGPTTFNSAGFQSSYLIGSNIQTGSDFSTGAIATFRAAPPGRQMLITGTPGDFLISPNPAVQGQLVTLTKAAGGFGAAQGSGGVFVDGVSQSVQSWSDTVITFTLGDEPYSNRTVTVRVYT